MSTGRRLDANAGPARLGEGAAEQQLMQGLRSLADIASQNCSDELFFRRCVTALPRVFGAHTALIGMCLEQPRGMIRTLALQRHDQLLDSFDYALNGSPCKQLLQRHFVSVQEQLGRAYPESQLLQQLPADSYWGRGLYDNHGSMLGVLVLLDDSPQVDWPGRQTLFELFAERIAQQLERRRTQAELRLAESVFDHSHQAIMITDPNDRIIKVNASFTRITGYSADEAEGQPAQLLSSGRHDPSFFQEIRDSLYQEGHWRGELWNRRREGEVYPEQRVISVLRDAAGEIEYYVSMFSDISSQKYAAERIHHLAHYDPTTDLPNRLLFQDFLTQSLILAKRNQQKLAVLFLDLDGFKLVNDTLGHPAGDQLLLQIAARLSGRLRQSDMLARVGGDEFALAVTEFRHGADVAHVARELLTLVAQPVLIEGQEHAVSASIGIAVYPDDGKDVASLMRAADTAMYRSKDSGKGRYTFFEPEMNRQNEELLRTTANLRRAIDERHFELHFQPQYDLQNGDLVGVEALLRWRHQDRLVMPAQFISVSEQSGLILPLGQWVLEDACRQARAWLDLGLGFGRVSVNVSGRQMRQGSILNEVKRALQKYQLPPEYLELELTESWVMEEPDEAIRLMGLLRRLGVGLAIDDFGVAHSSMNYLKHLPVASLKIDRSFIRDIPNDRNDNAIAEAMIAVGHSLNLDVVAEGVETAQQRAFLIDAGCDVAQGFLFGKVVEAKTLQAQLSERVEGMTRH